MYAGSAREGPPFEDPNQRVRLSTTEVKIESRVLHATTVDKTFLRSKRMMRRWCGWHVSATANLLTLAPASLSLALYSSRRRRNRNADGEKGKEYGWGEYRYHVVSNARTRWRNKAVSAVPRPGRIQRRSSPHFTSLGRFGQAKPICRCKNDKNRDAASRLARATCCRP
jgi:hypothetical protein